MLPFRRRRARHRDLPAAPPRPAGPSPREAVEGALADLYGADAVPRRVGYCSPSAELSFTGCLGYRARGHWHYVTHGFGTVELTLRVPCGTEGEAPGWPFTVLHDLAAELRSRGAVPRAGMRIDLRSSVTGHPDLPDAPSTGLTGFVLVPEPQLPEVGSTAGRVIFLQAVGVTAREGERIRAGGAESVLAGVRRADPLLLTDPARA